MLMGTEPGTPAGRELDMLVDLVELYESRHEPMGPPTALIALPRTCLAGDALRLADRRPSGGGADPAL